MICTHCRLASGTLLAVLLTQPVLAQDRCEDVLREAEADFENGRIEEALRVEEACLEGRASVDEQVRALALLAKAWVSLDDIEKARVAVMDLVRLDPDYRPGRLDPVVFRDLVEAARASRVAARVGTVSKTDEPLREAPATVVVVTAEEIERRGYTDLEQVLHDLPGFDISRGNGDVYSNVYMRGYRSDRSDRMLFIIDGVEQNDLHSNTAYISRQVALSNIAQIEVVYGPASTIYGPNAFTGVISITTRPPEAFIEDGRNFGVHAQVGSGTYGTRFIDTTLAGRLSDGRLSWSITGRVFQSDERDLSGFDAWDYDPSLSDVNYFDLMRITGPLAADLADFGIDFDCGFEGFCVVRTVDGAPVIELTPQGEEVVRQRDREFLEGLGDERRVFEDETDDWSIDARLRVGNFTFGLQTWSRDEGTTAWYTDLLRTGNDNAWVPRSTAIYGRYTQPIGRSVVLSLFSRFKQHEAAAPSRVTRLVTYAGGDINLAELAFFGDALPALQQISFDQKSTQIRNEITLVYEPSSRFNIVSGVELRNSTVQIEFKSEILETMGDGFIPFLAQLTDSEIDLTDFGIFTQASYKVRDDLKIVAGGRLDINSVGDDSAVLVLDQSPRGSPDFLFTQEVPLEDTGSVFNPRLAVVHTRGDFVFKAIYAEAFKDPSNFQKFSREPGVREFVNPELESESVENFELHLNWQPRDELAVDVVAYQADYSNAIGLRQVVNPAGIFAFPTNSGRFVNIGRLEIRGVQATASLRWADYDFFGNYTYTDPKNVSPTDPFGNPLEGIDELRVGDIARHRLNLGVNRPFGDRWNLNVRTNYVGERETGPGTTVPSSSFTEIDDYFVAHTALSYKGLLPGATWQLVVDNLFDTEFYHPGVQQAGEGFADRLPQPGRAVFVRLSYKR